MKKKMKMLLVLIMVLCFMNSSVLVSAADNDVYTYTYDFFEDYQNSPNPYEVLSTISYESLGLDKQWSKPQGLFIRDNMIYICDTGNNRILQIERDEDKFTLVRVIDSFTGDTDPLTFSGPSDIYVTETGEMFICDTNNYRVVKIDADLNYMLSFVKPTDTTFDQSLSYLPSKIVVDSVGRAFVLATNVNKGLIKYESDGTFTGFVGATEAKYSMYDYLWKLVSTQAQQAQMANFVPTEYDNIYMDADGFIYAVTTHFDEDDIRGDTAKPIRRLNSMGSDILIRNGNEPPIGDLYWDDAAGMDGPSKLIDITALENDIYVAVDRTRGKIFGYDSQGNLLYVFGGHSNMEGYFLTPSAIEHMGNDLLVLDSENCTLTVMKTTTYGNYIYEAIDLYQKGKYEESANVWRKVLTLNGNYDMAYIGIGRALIRTGEYKQAMEYFEITWDDVNYGKAFKLYRKEWIEDHIVQIFIGAFLILVLPLIIGKVKKIKGEVEKYEHDRTHN